MKDYYIILGINHDATEDEIKIAYRKLIKENHPDNFINDPGNKAFAEEKMKDIIEAYKYIIAHLNDLNKTQKKVDYEDDTIEKYKYDKKKVANNIDNFPNKYHHKDIDEYKEDDNEYKDYEDFYAKSMNKYKGLSFHHYHNNYYNNNETEFIRIYKDNNIYNDYQEYEDGILRVSCHIEDEHHMTKNIYSDDKHLILQIHYKDNKLDGEFKRWHRNGRLNKMIYFKDGMLNGEYKEYCDNGQIETQVYFKDNNLNGECKMWHPNGQLEELGYYKDGKENGEYKEYYNNGQIEFSCNYKDGKMNGEFIAYRDNGDIFIHALYKDDIKIKNYWFSK